MRTGASWGHREIDDDTGEAAPSAARRFGRSLAQSLNDVIADDRAGNASSAAIERLTRSIRALDETSRSGFADLRRRLDEVVVRLRGASAAATDVSAAVGDVAGTVGDAGETARAGLDASRAEVAEDRGVDRIAEAIRRLEAQLSERAGSAAPGPDAAPLASLNEIKARLDALLAGAPVPEFTLREREERPDLGALARGQQKIADSLEALHAGLTALAGRLAAFGEGLAASDKGLARLDAIDGEIAAIRQALEAAENPRDVGRLEMRLAELARAVEAALRAANAVTRPVAGAIQRLETRLDTVLARIDKALDRSEPEPQRAVLDEIKAGFVALRRDVAERDRATIAHVESRIAAARDAPRAAVGDPVQALSRDLEDVRKAAGEVDRRTKETLGSVHASLAEVVERLGRLEGGRDQATQMSARPLTATGTNGAGMPFARARPGSMAEGPSGAARPADGGRPCEPRVVRADLAALRELARSAARGEKEPAIDRRADFIAAARRAAQAAVAASASEGDADAGADDPGALARIGRAVHGRRRALLAGAAVVVLAVPAVHMAGYGRVAPVETPVGTGTNGASSSDGMVVASGMLPADRAAEAVPAREPPEHATAFAFAAPEPVEGRFGALPDTPPTEAFARALHPVVPLPLDEAIGPADLREAAAAGDPDAAVAVAAVYAEGRVVPPDLARAAQWYEVAAKAGLDVAQYRLASLYERGQGVAEDRTAAAAWYRRAAEQGNAGAMHNLGVMLSDGIEGVPNYREAVEWFRAAADRGVADSQYNLAVIYARGLGLDQDFVESYRWFALAAATGDREAGARRDEVGKLLSPDELARAHAAAAAWRATPAPEGANAVASLPDEPGDPTVGIGEADRRSLVMKIQALLAEQGYDPGPADGVEGPRTQEAVRAFQRMIGLAETGMISSDLVAALVDPSG